MTATDLSSPSPTTTSSTARRRTGWALTTLPAAFLLFDGVLHLPRPHAVVQSFTDLGYPVGLARPLGVLALICLTLHLLPRTAPLGAVLLTGYLGELCQRTRACRTLCWAPPCSRSTSGRHCGPGCGCATTASARLSPHHGRTDATRTPTGPADPNPHRCT